MIDAAFISDLHLHPDEKLITERFEAFIDWAVTSVKRVYILGDFFHAWPGDDALDDWSRQIATRLALLSSNGVLVYYMHGNRDFLLGRRFLALAGMHLLKEPFLLNLCGEKVLLAHGDRFCTRDKSHQRLRRLTRNPFFSAVFLRLPYRFRKAVVDKVRKTSSMSFKPSEQMDVVTSSMISHLNRWKVFTLIHGHTHKPGHSRLGSGEQVYQQYVLSDWDDSPLVLCYDRTKSFYFKSLCGEG